MQIGRKIYYKIATGEVLYPALETRDGGLLTTKEQDLSNYPQLKSVDPNSIDYIQLAFNERELEIQNMGSMQVDPTTKVLTITPKV